MKAKSLRKKDSASVSVLVLEKMKVAAKGAFQYPKESYWMVRSILVVVDFILKHWT